MVGMDTDTVPRGIDGPSLVAAASGLTLLPENASRLIRLHRLAALGMTLADSGAPPISPTALRSILKREDINGDHVLVNEDPYSEVLVQSITFMGGPYLVSPGSGEHTVADLENLIEAAFRERWMPDDLGGPARQLIRGLLTISDIVLKRAGLTRGTLPKRSPRTPVYVPGAKRLKELAEAAFISDEDLDSHGSWLRMVVDTFALDPGTLDEPCADDITDDRLYIMPFLRLKDGYLVILPLDLLITIRFHLLRLALQAKQLEELGKGFHEATFRRFMRLLPHSSDPLLLEQSSDLSRYLIRIDSRRDLHVIIATDTLLDWTPEVWGTRDTRVPLTHLETLVSASARRAYSSAEELLHLVIADSPGRGAFWGVPNVVGSDPMLIARSDDLEVILHQEPDGLLGLLLFAQAIEGRPGRSMSTDILDEFCAYTDHEKSFYFSDDAAPTFTVFQAGDGFNPRKKYYEETDRHGVILPLPNQPVVEARRRYDHDAPEIFIIEPNSSYIGYVVEVNSQDIFVTLDLQGAEPLGPELEILDCVAYWVLECVKRADARASAATVELVLRLSDPGSWRSVGEQVTSDPAVRATRAPSGFSLEFTRTFAALLEDVENTAERELVSVLLNSLFRTDGTDVASAVDRVAPLGPKRLLHAFDQTKSPDMQAERLPRALTGHDQVTAQLLDELGGWLRSPNGGGFSAGEFIGEHRVRLLNAAVGHLFERLEEEVLVYGQRDLLDFLLIQNESLVHEGKLNTIMLRSRLACFGEQSDTVTELVKERKKGATAQRANRFLIEYVAARPPAGELSIELLDYYRIHAIATEIVERATTSDFLHYGLADFQVSILGSGRLGVSREEQVVSAMETYAANLGMHSVRDAVSGKSTSHQDDFDFVAFISRSESAMRAEFGFTLDELRAVCGGLLDLSTPDRVSRIDRSTTVSMVSKQHDMPEDLVSAVLSGIALTEWSSGFLEIGSDAWPWRFNRDRSFLRRPLVLQGNELVFGFRGIYRLGPYWIDNILSGRLQGRAKTAEMKQLISEARGKINDAFAVAVADRLKRLGMTTRVSVKKIGGTRIVDSSGYDLGDIDVLAVHPGTRSIIAVEAKDFEVARTPAEIAGELEKLFVGKRAKKSTVELHARRIDWLRKHVREVALEAGEMGDTPSWRVVGVVVTSEPLITPLVSKSTIPVIPFEDLGLEALNLEPGRASLSKRNSERQKKRKNRRR